MSSMVLPPGLSSRFLILRYIGAAIVWLWAVDGVRPSAWDVAGVAVALLGMALIAFQPR